jgi:hypothetical protein
MASFDDGGSEVSWSQHGKELFYRVGGRRMMVAEYQTQPTFSVASPGTFSKETTLGVRAQAEGPLYIPSFRMAALPDDQDP